MVFSFEGGEKNRDYENAIEVLFSENYEKVYRKALSILLDPELAKDATQETFFRAFCKLHTLKDKSKFGPWVCSIAVNVSCRMLEQKIKYRRKNQSIYDDDGNMIDNLPGLADLNDPDDICENVELWQELKHCIDELDIETQQIIYMKIYGGFSIQEIAAVMDMKEGTVKSRIHRAKRKVADRYRKMIDKEE